MKSNLLMNFSVDKENKKINVKREFAAPISKVWAAWTQSELLDQWWAPKPYVAKTKSMDFSEGGRWLYSMTGPEGDVHWSCADYRKITNGKSYEGLDAFCDAEGNINDDFPRTNWKVNFSENANSTLVDIELSFKTLADLEKLLELGFKEGFTMGLGNLDELLAK